MDRCPVTALDGMCHMWESDTLSCSEQTGEIYVVWHIVCSLVSLCPEGNLIQWCTEQVEWLPRIPSHLSKDKTPVSVVVLNVSLWLISHENGTQSNRKDSISSQCFRPHGELFQAGLVCGKEVLSSGCYRVSLNCDSTGSWPDPCLQRAWPWALRYHPREMGTISAGSCPWAGPAAGGVTPGFIMGSALLWAHRRHCPLSKEYSTYLVFFPYSPGHTCGDNTGDRSTSGWSPAVPGSWQWHFCLAAVCTGALCLFSTAGAVSGWRRLRVHQCWEWCSEDSWSAQ